MVSLLEVHLGCAALFVMDLGARALRIQLFLRGLGRRLSLGQAVQVIAWGDAAAGLTPLRFGGELAKLARLLRAGVAPTPALAALALEAVVTYPLVALFGGWLAWRFAPAWWHHARPAMQAAVAARWPWLAAIVVVSLGIGLAGWRWRRRVPGAEDPAATRAMLGSMPIGPILAAVPLSLFNVMARTLMLPLLALTLPDHPPIGVMAVGSFVLLYSQLVLPTPAGAGAVDLGFLSGVAGHFGPGTTGLLLAWRLYTVGAGTILGCALAVRDLGVGPLSRSWVFGAGRQTPAAASPTSRPGRDRPAEEPSPPA
ncbi:MAG TPA: lysylphosphatidylglycerol synthase domain-containing protein [Gemmatimonadales bacterium]